MTTYYCAHCGQPRPVKPGYTSIDPTFALVICGDDERAGHHDKVYVQGLLDAKKAKALAKRKATLAAKAEAEAAYLERNR